MCPASYVLVDDLPLTKNGKVDRASLPAPDRAPFTGNGGGRRLPKSEAEQALAAIWQRVLGVPQVGLDDDFFDLGGTSLGAVKVLVAVKEQLGVSLHMSVWAGASTVAGFASACSATARAPAASALPVEESILPTR
jgi:acyl carrier protein